MKFRLYREFGALNSPKIFDAFAQGVTSLGHEVVTEGEGIPVIWSVLWNGRMSGNRAVYYQAKSQKKPVVIIEVGNLKRNVTWRISVDNVNRQGFFGNFGNFDNLRPRKLGVSLKPVSIVRQPHILIATQHQKSLQWEGLGTLESWLNSTVSQIRRFSSRPIVVRPHPRSRFHVTTPGVTVEVPKIIKDSYDNYDIDYDCHCVINHCSGPSVQAAIHGTPTICDSSGLAYDVSERWENLENPQLPDREQWFLELCHTEWTEKEIASGEPLERLLPRLVVYS